VSLGCQWVNAASGRRGMLCATRDGPAGTVIPPIDELDDWLLASEKALAIAEPVRKIVRWAGGRPDRTSLSIMYIHGFTATRQETAPLADEIAAALGANLFYTRLTGHGLGTNALRDVTLDDWLVDVREGFEILERIGRQQIIIGASTGATLAALHAVEQRMPGTIRALIMLSPNYGPFDRRAEFVTMPGGLALARALVGDVRSFEPVSEEHSTYWTRESPVEALVPMMHAVKRLRKHFETREIRLPALTIYCPQDQTVLPEFIETQSARYVNSLSRSVVLEEVGDPSCHTLAGDILSPQTTAVVRDAAIEFINEVIAERRGGS